MTQKTVGRLKSRPQFLAVREGEKRRGSLFLIEVLDRKLSDAANPRWFYRHQKSMATRWNATACAAGCEEAVRLHAGFAMQPGHDYVVIARRDVLTAPFEKLAGELVSRIETRPKHRRPETDRSRKV